MAGDGIISIVLPVLNEAQGLRKILPLIPKEVGEVIVVDNGSTDESCNIAAKYNARIVSVACRGYGLALHAGISAACGEIIVFMDADATSMPSEIARLVEPIIASGYDFVSGKREFKNRGLFSVIGNLFMRGLVKLLYNIELTDTQSGMCAFKKNIFKNIESKASGMSFSQEIKLNAYLNKNIKTLEVPVSSSKREGKMKYRVFTDSLLNVYNFGRFYVKRQRSFGS